MHYSSYLFVFIGGGFGTALRHAVNVAFARWFGSDFPFYTLFENVSGSLVMGMLAGYFAFRGDLPQEFRLFLTTGIIGGYTTFSAFSLDTVLLWERGAPWAATGYVILSVIASIAALVAGLMLVRHLA